MKTLLVDAGNTGIKWCLLSGSDLSEQQRCSYKKKSPQDCFKEIIKSQKQSLNAIYLVSVLGEAFSENAKAVSSEHDIELHNITSQKDLAGIQNAYDEPHKLGADRLLAMIGAKHHYKSEDQESSFIIIDSGTATTVDAFNQDGKHYGGLILPGIDLCTQSLLKNTKQLPLWGSRDSEEDTEDAFKPEIFSKNTAQAIQSASVFGLAGAIDSICSKMKSKMSKDSNIKTVLCGGNTYLLQPYLNSGYILNENLIMLGLKTIAELQNQKTS